MLTFEPLWPYMDSDLSVTLLWHIVNQWIPRLTFFIPQNGKLLICFFCNLRNILVNYRMQMSEAWSMITCAQRERSAAPEHEVGGRSFIFYGHAPTHHGMTQLLENAACVHVNLPPCFHVFTSVELKATCTELDHPRNCLAFTWLPLINPFGPRIMHGFMNPLRPEFTYKYTLEKLALSKLTH